MKLIEKPRSVLYMLAVFNAAFIAIFLAGAAILIWKLFQSAGVQNYSKTFTVGLGILVVLILIRYLARDTSRLVNFLILTKGGHGR